MRGPILLIAIGGCAAANPWATTGSVYRGPCTHVGIRPASDGWGDVALTVQVSTDAPPCPPSRDAGRVIP